MMIQLRLFKIFIYINMTNTNEDVNTVIQGIFEILSTKLQDAGIDSGEIDSMLTALQPSIESELTKMMEQDSMLQPCDYDSIIDHFNNNFNIDVNTLNSDNFAEIEITISNMFALINTYRQIYEKHFNRIKELSETRTAENKDLTKNIHVSEKLINTNKRKTVYEKREFNSLQFYRLILFITFYVLLGLYLVFGNFFSSRLYRNRMFMMFFIPLCITPLIAKYIIRVIYYVIKKLNYFLNNNAPKNVYTNI